MQLMKVKVISYIMESRIKIVKPWPQTLSPKTKTKGPWADTKISCPAKKISGGQQEEG